LDKDATSWILVDPLNPVAAAREAKLDAWETLAFYGADPNTDLDALADAADAVALAEAAYNATSAIDDAVQQLPKTDAEAASMNARAAFNAADANADALDDAFGNAIKAGQDAHDALAKVAADPATNPADVADAAAEAASAIDHGVHTAAWHAADAATLAEAAADAASVQEEIDAAYYEDGAVEDADWF
jgi:trimeric autotransporter adhesin